MLILGVLLSASAVGGLLRLAKQSQVVTILTSLLPNRLAVSAAESSTPVRSLAILAGVTAVVAFLALRTFSLTLEPQRTQHSQSFTLLGLIEVPGKFGGLLKKDLRYYSRLLDLYFVADSSPVQYVSRWRHRSFSGRFLHHRRYSLSAVHQLCVQFVWSRQTAWIGPLHIISAKQQGKTFQQESRFRDGYGDPVCNHFAADVLETRDMDQYSGTDRTDRVMAGLRVIRKLDFCQGTVQDAVLSFCFRWPNC